MTEPKRWSSPGSDVDPVLRSVLLYARDQQPSSEQLQTLLRGAARPRALSRPRRAAAWFVAAGVALGAGGAWAVQAAGWAFRARPPAPSVTVSAPRLEVLAPREAAPRRAVVPSSIAPPTPRLAPPPLSAKPVASGEQDAALLQEARRALANNPDRALTLTREHELRFPSSALTEERQALRIEALRKLGHDADADRELSRFDQRFPRSIYGRRLHALAP